MTKFPWEKYGAGWRAEMPSNVTLYADPDRTRGVLGDKPARGTHWKAGASQWDEATRTLSRYGRDTYRDQCDDAKSAKALAEAVYLAV